jgi:DNA modification methylase
MEIVYSTSWGSCYQGLSEDILRSNAFREYQGEIDLIFTSPPFPLNRKKKYGNLQGKAYITWLASFAPLFRKFLKPAGSIVIEVGNSWVRGRPIMSTLALQALLEFLNQGEFLLCQQFIWNNPARLPSPAQWVNVERIRVKDSFTHLWWMSTTDRPKANNRNVLTEYSNSMRKLLARRKYNAGERPSEHHIGETSFLKDHGGAIPSNVITLANTAASSRYLNYCRANGLKPHAVRMPIGLAEFFIKFLTDPGDLVLDPFAGSNTTGAAVERLERSWIAIESSEEYVKGSRRHFIEISGQQNLPL